MQEKIRTKLSILFASIFGTIIVAFITITIVPYFFDSSPLTWKTANKEDRLSQAHEYVNRGILLALDTNAAVDLLGVEDKRVFYKGITTIYWLCEVKYVTQYIPSKRYLIISFEHNKAVRATIEIVD